MLLGWQITREGDFLTATALGVGVANSGVSCLEGFYLCRELGAAKMWVSSLRDS